MSDAHEFNEDVDDGSMCMCGVPALTHHLVEPALLADPGDSHTHAHTDGDTE